MMKNMDKQKNGKHIVLLIIIVHCSEPNLKTRASFCKIETQMLTIKAFLPLWKPSKATKLFSCFYL